MEITEIRYRKISAFFSRRPLLLRILKFVYRVFPIIYAASYILLLIYLLILGETVLFWRTVIFPASAFITVTIFRIVCNSPRPYEVFNIDPIIKRNKSGQSFPSRHCTSAFVISTVSFSASVWLGTVLSAVAVCIAVSRIFAGVHFVKDVIAGMLIGIFFGLFIFTF